MQPSIRTILAAALLAACSGAVDPGETGRASASAATTTEGSTGDGSTGDGSTGDATAPTGEATTASGAPAVALNEISSVGADAGEWAGKGDLIELYNAGDAPVDLSGYQLSDDMTLPADKTYVFPDGTSLAPGAWLVLAQYDDMSGAGDFPFGLSQDKEETLVLADAGGQPVDSVTFDGAAAKGSYCRVPDGQGEWMPCAQTFGAANAAPSAGCGDGVADAGEACDGADLGGQTCVGLGFTGGALACTPQCTHDTSGCEMGEALVLNELEATNDDIELYNAGNAPIDISGWILTDDLVDQNYDPMADPEKLVFAAQTTIAAKGFLVVPKGQNVNQHAFGLGTDGDTVTLLKPNLELVDQVSYAAGEADASYCRLPDGPGGAWTPMCAPTQGAPNEGN